MSGVNPQIEAGWLDALRDEFDKEYFASLKQFLLDEKRLYKIYPPGNRIFAAFDFTPFSKVKVVLLGQDPYHGEGQAHGLCFSVPEGVKPPPSLVNIFQELNKDLGIPVPNNGNLEKWASQGVLLLNATLTVRANMAGSHQKKGWEIFTDAVITKLSERSDRIVFLLWGNYAQAKEVLIDTSKHAVLKAAHPSPFSVYRGFFGCRHFSKTNEILTSFGKTPINWRLD
ncbi:MAG TPA: uracil-DNA glycosylase [Bacteroidales bacterium]|nr:uracil-DNA glycosylase [Bacteroidales bacterium]